MPKVYSTSKYSVAPLLDTLALQRSNIYLLVGAWVKSQNAHESGLKGRSLGFSRQSQANAGVSFMQAIVGWIYAVTLMNGNIMNLYTPNPSR